MPWAEVAGDRATIHNIRNCDYVTEINYTPRWETKGVSTFRYSRRGFVLEPLGNGLDRARDCQLRVCGWEPLATSIEARKTVGQEYSAIRGFFRQFQMMYLISEEQDVVRVRTNYRGRERVSVPDDDDNARCAGTIRALSEWMNQAHAHAGVVQRGDEQLRDEFCFDLSKAKIGGISPWDWRTLFVGKGDELLYEKGDLVGDGLPFAELKRRALIRERPRRRIFRGKFA